ncbi:MAG: hypothetical protein KF773_00285 [Deltaproteobacteria bacterium]|nr:hypothetical protein [Deltaproteobacteria bacterium]
MRRRRPLRTLFGLAAIGGAIAYARKHGGFKNAFHELMQMKDDFVRNLASRADQAVSDRSGSERVADIVKDVDTTETSRPIQDIPGTVYPPR